MNALAAANFSSRGWLTIAGPTAAATTVRMATEGGANIVYTMVAAILGGCPRRSTPIDAEATPAAAPTPTATTPTPTVPKPLTRTVSTQSQTTYKWWWSEPRFVPLPEHSHGVGLIDPFFNPPRGCDWNPRLG